MNSIDVYVEDIPEPDWIAAVVPLLDGVLQHYDVKNVECSVVLCDNSYIAELNQQYRQIAGPTDVLSFCGEEGDPVPLPADIPLPRSLGDIVISLEYVRANAERFAVPYEEELRRVIIHGVLHLLGHDHASNDAQEPMLQQQEQLVQTGDKLF